MLHLMSFSPSNFGRFVPPTEQDIDESNGINEWTPPAPANINEIPSLISLSTAPSSPPPPPPPIIPANISQNIPISSAIIKDDVEVLPFPSHAPGPIQRPNKLTCPPTQPAVPSYLTSSIQSPGTPDVLDHLNRLLNHQSSVSTTIPSTPNVNPSSIPINDLTTPNIPWTTFSPTEWSSKYDSTWPLTNIQSPTVPLTVPTQNPFALISTINQPPRSSPREEATVWSSVLGTATPRLVSSSTRTQRASTWNDLFQSTVPSASESTRPPNGSMLKYWSAPDPASADAASSNGHVTATTNPFWNLDPLSNEPVASSPISNPQQVSSTTWWTNSSSDENNNKNPGNHLADDSTTNRDQSRWDFAR